LLIAAPTPDALARAQELIGAYKKIAGATIHATCEFLRTSQI